MRYAKDINGKIRIFNKSSIPDGEISSGGTEIQAVGLKYASDAVLAQFGYYPYLEPSYDPSTQKLSAIYFDNVNNIFTRNVVSLTPQELEDLEVQEAIRKENEIVENGVSLIRGLRGVAREKLNEGNLTQAQYDSITSDLRDVLYPLLVGDWLEAQAKVNAITPPADADMLEVYNYIKDEIDNYVANDL